MLQRHLLRVKPNADTQCCTRLDLNLNKNLFLRCTNAHNLLSFLTDSINHLVSDMLLQLAMNGPNVKWLVLGMLDDKLEPDNFARSLHIGICAQHIHGVLKEGSHKTVWNLYKLLKSLLWLFNDSPAKLGAYLFKVDTDKFPTRFALPLY